MVKSYLTIALRTFLRQKMHTLINLFGLSVGMACTLLILIYVNYEMSYDDFHSQKDNLYRVNKVSYSNGVMNYKSAFTFSGQGPVMKSEIPEVTEYARLLHAEGTIQYGTAGRALVSFREKDIYYADASFFNLFSYRLINGNPQSALLQPKSIVLSESAAARYFGSDNPVGKSVSYRNDDFVVTGVVRDPPTNSHLAFSALISFSSLRMSDAESWTNHSFYTYILLKDNTDPKQVEPQLSRAFERFIDRYFGGKTTNFWELQRVDNIYLHSTDFTSVSMEYGNYTTVLCLLVIAVLVLIIAWVNFINLSTARLPERVKEIGIRKTLGASKNEVVTQFVMESVVLNVGAVVLCLALVAGSLHWLSEFLGTTISLFPSGHAWLWGACVLLLLVGISLTSIYSALFLSSVPIISAVKRTVNRARGGAVLRKVLITFQFAVSVALIIIILLMSEQMSYTRNRDLGMDLDNVLVVRAPGAIDQQTADLGFDRFRQMLSNNPMIRHVSISRSVPGERFGYGNYGDIYKEGSPTQGMGYFRIGRVDSSFISLYSLRLLAGKNFSTESEDRNAVIVNEEAARALGFAGTEDPVGRYLRWNGRLVKIVGVVGNFHQESLHKSIEPIVVYTSTFDQSVKYISVKLGRGDARYELPFVEKTYKAAFPGQPFDSFFLTDFFNKQYQSDLKTGEIIFSFAFLAILLAVLGLLGLVSSVTAKRTKEIGIRKVVGAGVLNIVSLLVKDFLTWVVTANLIAWPVAYFFMRRWLQEFAYRTEIDWRIFVLSCGISLIVALATLSYHAVKAATANPVEALRYE